ncbi:MAG TPA: HlyD family efflux transporter periplasmic adaptor subunit [Oscillospiraceae bacterium]|nr:HlyD family efflux transporter periplasmic adaptor subunit [Oscillospiraceae bacterium]
MDEIKVKKRDWVKNAAIIFLAVMLALTFFSNTIMNRSLPEVATQAVTSGEITSKVRGTGTVTANENYTVTLDQTREIASVKVKAGDTVKAGQVLFTLSASDSDELISARDAVDSAGDAYQKQLIEAAKNSGDVTVTRAREALEDAKTNFAACVYVTAAQVAAAKQDYNTRIAVTNSLEAEYNKAKAALDNAGGWTEPSGSGDYSTVESAAAALSDAQTTLSAARIQYNDKYTVFENIAKERMAGTGSGYSLDANKKALYEEYSTYLDSTGAPASNDTVPTGTSADPKNYKMGEMAQAYAAITTAQSKVNSAQNAYNSAQNAYSNSVSSSTSGNYSLKVASDKANIAYQAAKVDSDTAKGILDNLTSNKTDYDTAKQAVYDKEDALTTALAGVQTSSLDLNTAKRALARAQEKLADVAKGAAAADIKAQVDGVMKTVDAVAGKKYDAAATLATIELPEQGYTVSFSVTNDQARKVHSGDEAEITNYGSDSVQATLQSIKPDPQNAQTNKLLVFNITGDVEPGATLTISVGEKSAQYDAIVPNSSIRSDANGDFVLVVMSKSSPLGNRYIATRMDIEKVASDETNTAVSGGLNYGDYVITTSSKPINDKDYVKLADS